MLLRYFKVNLFIGLVVLGVSGIALGEEDKAFEVESITVTAEKRAEDIQDVPVSITAFTETELEDAGVETIADVINMIPNMIAESSIQGLTTSSCRGIGPSTFTGKNPVVIYVDGVPLDDQSNYDADLFDIERVEVLRGPQGTLYGKNAIGGVINIISKKPDNILQTKLSGELGQNETYGMKGYINGPLIKDALFMGFSGKYRETRGFMKNDNPDQDYFDSEAMKSLKTVLRWLPSDRLEVDLHAFMDLRRDGAGNAIASDKVRYHENRDPDDKSNSDLFGSALNISYSAGFANFTSITTYKRSKYDYRNNNFYLNTSRFEATNRSDSNALTQEFRIQSREKDNEFKWLGGLYYSNTEWRYDDYSVVFDTKAYYGYNTKYNWPYDLDEEIMAVFGQITVPLVSSLNFTAGLRYERTNKEMNYRHYDTRTDTGALLSSVEWNRSDAWDALLPKGVLSWNVNKNSMLFASATQGYLAGGLNFNSDDRESAKFDAQTSLSYELGAKTAWFDNKFFLNTTLFYVDIEDMHVWSNPEPGIYIASNAAKAHTQGVEIEARARPLPGFDIAASFGWIDGEYDDYKKDAATDYTGKSLMQTPAYTCNLSVKYRHVSGFFARAEMEGYGSTYYDEANLIKRDPVQLYRAKIGYEASSWDIYCYCNNLLNEEYFSTMEYGNYTVGEPRTLGIIATVRF